MADYKLSVHGVTRTSDGASIPKDPGNRDWRKYEAWLREGNTPDQADPPRPRPTDADAAEAAVNSNAAIRAIVAVLANDKGITERAMIDAIRAEAKP